MVGWIIYSGFYVVVILIILGIILYLLFSFKKVKIFAGIINIVLGVLELIIGIILGGLLISRLSENIGWDYLCAIDCAQ